MSTSDKEHNKKIFVTKSFLPPQEEYESYLQGIWQRGQLTNQGPLLKEFEVKTKNYLGISDFHFVANGTVALQLALSALDVSEGEVITTPFSYVATTSAILWERCTPVFVDINPETYCIDAEKIEAAITEKTKAILAVHVFGNPCDVDEIQKIAERRNLKVIYDAAHAFGVNYKGKSLLSYGDISTSSFHATKLFHTIEGGCIIANDKDVSERLELVKHFGHVGDDHYVLGINAKASEFQAAMGLCNLKYVDSLIAQRKDISELYDRLITDNVIKPVKIADSTPNYAYYPVVFKNEARLKAVFEKLAAKNIFPRRYFYPSLNKLPYVENQSCPVSEDISLRIACLPLYPGLEAETVKLISQIINES
jgi:dTDP-4-amino-4,6-dideoxygalactose transaminase